MMSYAWVEELKIDRFSGRALDLVSRFGRAVKQLNGASLNLHDPMLVSKIFNAVRQTRNPELKKLFDALLVELHILVEKGDAVRCPEAFDDDALKALNEQRIGAATASIGGVYGHSIHAA